MPFDPEEFRTRMQLENFLFRAETELENSLVYAVVKKARGADEAGVRAQLEYYYTNSQLGKPYQPAWEGPIAKPVAPPQADIDANIRRARISYSPIWFIERLTPGGEMDYKHGKGNIIYEDFGNFNYGAVSLAFGLSTEASLRGAGVIQILANAYRKISKEGIESANNGHVRQRGVNSGVLEVALGQAALGGIWAGCASFGWVLSSAMASTCM
ncbi:MAG: polymorphic toxin type 44 domain-containing protein [Solidesulfovibrio sp. DCME]|uniref:polymorphic toxin type 44 domain-containing protein n=1 Tax=Solidesulfovibrio sp. DCME TaxID=3447380 RepID=UPI003D0E6237